MSGTLCKEIPDCGNWQAESISIRNFVDNDKRISVQIVQREVMINDARPIHRLIAGLHYVCSGFFFIHCYCDCM